MGKPTWWEIHEYNSADQPALAFTAGAGGHAGTDEFGTVWYVERESGWRDGAMMRDTSTTKLLGDGVWTGPQLKDPFLVILEGYFVAPSQDAMYASIRKARNTLGRTNRYGRLLAEDSDGKRLFADVTRGGATLVSPTSETVGIWSMSFKVDDPVYRSERTSSNTLQSSTKPVSGRGYTDAYRSAYQHGLTAGAGLITNGGDIPGDFVATITGPSTGFTLTDSATNRVLTFTGTIGGGQTGVLNTKDRTFFVNNQNYRRFITGQWFGIAPGTSQVFFQTSGGNANTKCVITYHRETWAG